MGAVHGCYLKYVTLSLSSGIAAYAWINAEPDDIVFFWGEEHVPEGFVLIFLFHCCLVNGVIAVLFKLGVGMSLLGKDPRNGRVPLWSYGIFMGFHVPTWLYTRLHHLKDRLYKVPPATEVEPGWWVGGRYGAELEKQWAGTIDLTCEFPEGCAKTTEQYLLVPCWDGVPPTPEMLEHAAKFALSASLNGDVMVHCAHGRGRSTTVMCACLVKAGLHPTWEAALDAIKNQRRVVKLNRAMRSALTSWQLQYQALTPRKASQPPVKEKEAAVIDEGFLHKPKKLIQMIFGRRAHLA
eukprot:TRINITY_DN32087_c0_g1_i1.p1 TRINITY_DN32087_c0_g1~~TRINITY_DN32087_c0_g1_i1.p1  ORF type:complete len:295 (-),score=40.06 TRINITY_DN32087_c0_g1_i1:96-980(-)